jgi:putative nucleotidyltransferase with HDIG domain
MQFPINEKEVEIFNLIKKAGKKLNVPTYIVGGYVRDRLLGRNIDQVDIDIVCVGSGIQLANQLAAMLSPKPKISIFERFGTAMFCYKGIDYEFVGARKESYSKDSRKPIVEDGSLDDDQKRRDFTINALAISLNDGNYLEIIDSFDGLADLENKIIRTPLNPDITFSDDPLRMMRAIRFACQLDYIITDDCMKAIARNAERIKIISKERIITEIEKFMTVPKPSQGWILLFKTNLLQYVFPELQAMAGVEAINNVYHKDNFYHTMKVLDNMAEKSNNLWLRWAALLHDIGKPQTKRFETNKWTFHGHDDLGAKMVPRIFNTLKLPTDARMRYVQKLVALHQRPIALTKETITDSAVRRIIFEASEDLEDLMLLCRCDITTRDLSKLERYLQNYDFLCQRIDEIESKDKIRNWQPPIDGQFIMDNFGLKPGPNVGILKNKIRDAILDGDISNNFDEAYQMLIGLAAELGLKPIQK